MEALDISENNRFKAKFITEESDRFVQLPEVITYMKLRSLLSSGLTIFVDETGSAILDKTKSDDEFNGNRRDR